MTERRSCLNAGKTTGHASISLTLQTATGWWFIIVREFNPAIGNHIRQWEVTGSMTVPANAHEMTEKVRTVRQARQYRPDPVPDSVVDELLELARWTGSSRNSQPWHFIVIDDKEQLRKISELRPPINWVADVPLAIGVVLDGENPTSETFDEGRVVERLLIGAHMLGLGGGIAWFGDASLQAKAKEILDIPEERMARGVVTIGYPTSIKDPRPGGATPGRKPLSELVSHNRMGNAKA